MFARTSTDTAVSICTTCYRRIDAKIVFEDNQVFMLKRCPTHGFERVLISDDVDYYRRCREVFIKPPEMPDRYNTPGQLRLPLRLRPLPRPRAALLPLAARNLRFLQSLLPHLLRAVRNPSHRFQAPRPDRAHARLHSCQ